MDRDYRIIAVDFDGTLCVEEYPDMGSPNISLIEELKALRSAGDKLILWSCRVGEPLERAVKWCGEYGLYFDSVNANIPEMIEYWGNDNRKVFADIYIDDKAIKPNWEEL